MYQDDGGHHVCSGDLVDPLSVDRQHGRVLITCTADVDFLSDFSVEGTCAPRPGTCGLPRP